MSPARSWNDPRWRLTVLIAALVAVGAVVLAARLPRQDGDEPAASPPATSSIMSSVMSRDVPVPDECQVAPRSLASLPVPGGTPAADPGTAMASPTAIAPPVGRPADPETIAAVVATYREVTACFNAGDYPRAFALYSEEYLVELFAAASEATQISPDVIVAVLATPRVVPAMEWTAIRAIGDVQVLPDGRVSAFVVTASVAGADPTGGTPLVVFFVERDGRWLIDEIVNLETQGTPTP